MREQYISKLLDYKDKGLIKIVTGVRRCGKSFLLNLFHNVLIKQHVSEDHIIYINFEDFIFTDIQNDIELYNFLDQRILDTDHYYILLDEVQYVRNWERVVNSLRLRENVDLTITGSNASLLSSELGTLLAGRYILIEMYPLSFKEYLSFSKQNDSDKEIAFNNYLQFGAFPTVVLNDSRQLKTDFLLALYDSIMIKDIVARHSVRDVDTLHKVIRFVFDTIGNPLSIQKIVNTIKSSGGETSHEMVGNYLKYLEEAYVIYPVKRYDIKGKEILKTQGKYYVIDTGLRNLVVAPESLNFGFQLENLVYLELRRRGFEVHTGKIGITEIDFYCRRLDETVYIQISQSLISDETREREFRSLLTMNDNFPKIVLSMDKFDFSAKGIKNINILDFLFNGEDLLQ